jgi:DedD protein
MGLFSKLGKNKQESTGEDSGYYRAADDKSLADKAKSKRASHSDGGASRNRGRATREGAADPVLPEKKRARRRLVGAIALALAVAIGLPMILDSEPRPLATDIAIQIPSKDKPVAAEASPVTAPAPAPAPAKAEQAAALDKSEEIVEAPPAREPAKQLTAPPPVAAVKLAPEPVKETAKPVEAKVAKVEHKPEPKEPKPEPKRAEAKESKPEPKHLEAKEGKPAAKSGDDAARALAILEGKQAAASTRYVVQIAALSKPEKVEELQGKLREAGIRSTSKKISTASGELTRVQAGPFESKEEAEKVRAKLGKIGLNGKLIPA